MAGIIYHNANAATLATGLGTAGQPLVSTGASSAPNFTTLGVAGGGSGLTSTTAYAVLCGGTTSTSALQSVSGVGTSAQVLTSNGAAALPTWQDIPVNTAWFAYRSTDITNVTGDNTQYSIVFNTTLLNPSTAINTSTGTFTAPSAGNYFMSGAVLIKGMTSSHTLGLIYIRNTTAASTFLLGGEKNPYNAADTNGSVQLQFSGIAILSASDVVDFRLTVSGGTKVVDIQGQGVPYCTYWNIFKL